MAENPVKDVVSDLLNRVIDLENNSGGSSTTDKTVLHYAEATFSKFTSSSSSVSSSSRTGILEIDLSTINSVFGLSLTNVNQILGGQIYPSGSLSAWCIFTFSIDTDEQELSVSAYNTGSNSATISTSTVINIFYKES